MGLSSHPIGMENSPLKQITTPHPPEKDHQLLPQGSTCFDDQLTRPLYANLLLQHETVGIRTTKNTIVGYYVNTTVEHYGNVFVHKGEKTGETSISCQNAPDCTKLRLKFQNFPRGDTPGPPSLGRGHPSPDPSPTRPLDGPP